MADQPDDLGLNDALATGMTPLSGTLPKRFLDAVQQSAHMTIMLRGCRVALARTQTPGASPVTRSRQDAQDASSPGRDRLIRPRQQT
jgi:hypothetical protein